jgi:hypothetical protein
MDLMFEASGRRVHDEAVLDPALYTLPGCRRKAAGCELDHRVPYPAGGTNADNLQPLCARHHRMKHNSSWKIKKRPDGAYDWTSPAGHHYRYRPPELPVSEPPQPAPPTIDAEPPSF